MSRAAEKILADMRKTKSGWSAADFETLYVGYGFVKKGRKHDIYIHPVYTFISQAVPRTKKDLPPAYAVTAVKNIDLLLSLLQ